MPRRYDDDDSDVDDDFDIRRRRRSRRNSRAEAQLLGPAISLLTCSGLSLVVWVLDFMLRIFGTVIAPRNFAFRGMDPAANMAGVCVAAVLVFLTHGFIIFGAIQMKNRQTYGIAFAATIISLIPCFTPCIVLGIPFGIWALVIMLDENVKASFRS